MGSEERKMTAKAVLFYFLFNFFRNQKAKEKYTILKIGKN